MEAVATIDTAPNRPPRAADGFAKEGECGIVSNAASPRFLAALGLALRDALHDVLARARADFYQGKTLTIVVGFTAGGGYDIDRAALRAALGTLYRRQSVGRREQHAGRRQRGRRDARSTRRRRRTARASGSSPAAR